MDNLSEGSNRNTYTSFVGSKFPSVSYSPGMRAGVVASFEIKGKTYETKYSPKLGNEVMEGRVVESYGTFNAKERLAYNLRVGFSYENAIYFSDQKLAIASSTTNLTYVHPNFGLSSVPVQDMGGAMPMVVSNCITLGISRKKINDYKIELKDSKKFKGNRNLYGYS